MINFCPHPRPDSKTVCTVEGFLYFVWEREHIKLLKEKGFNTPWTDDEVFAKYKFTNIHRRDDRVSKWVINEIINLNLKNEDLWFTLLIARIINWPPTLEKLLYEDIIPCSPQDFNPITFSKVIEDRKKDSSKVYSGAYMIYPTKKSIGGNKSFAIAKYIIGDAVEAAGVIKETLKTNRIENFVSALSKCFGISTFMAGQVAADLTYAKGHLDKAEDLYSYAPLGPGSQRGLNYLLNRTALAPWSQKDFNNRLIDAKQFIEEDLRITDLTLHDVQNIMCEYSKYCRFVTGDGLPKTIYRPETEF
jgi:hypothetical protein